MLTADLIRADALTDEQAALWRCFQAATPSLQSPFFSPEFARAVGGARPDAWIATLRRDERIVGFLPHHRRPGGVGKPIGGQICDYQGVIAAADATIQPGPLLRALRLRAFDFNHAPTDQTALTPGAVATARSPFLDLSDGFDAWRAALPKAARHTVKETERRIRKMTREHGPLRFVLNDPDPAAWDALVRLKSNATREKGAQPVFDTPWIAETLARLRAETGPHFQGLLSTVYAGDRLAAAHFGLRAGPVWAWWLNTYDPALRTLAPGLITILEAARAAPEMGVRIIDFGRGEQSYKTAFATDATALCEGSVARRGSLAAVFRGCGKAARRVTATGRLHRIAPLALKASHKLAGGGVRLPAGA